MSTALEAKPTVKPVEIEPVKVGDVFTCSWGYDQTNVDFYAVTKVSASGKTAEFIKVAASIDESRDGGPSAVYKVANVSVAICATCMRGIRPLKTASGETLWRHTNGEVLCYTETVCVVGGEDYTRAREGREKCVATPDTFRRTLRWYGDEVWANAHASYASMKRWDGRPEYETAQGWGH